MLALSNAQTDRHMHLHFYLVFFLSDSVKHIKVSILFLHFSVVHVATKFGVHVHVRLWLCNPRGRIECSVFNAQMHRSCVLFG
jgi:hypothetical protein